MKIIKKAYTVFIALFVVATTLCACDSSDYKEAMALYEENNYQSAAALFEALGDYEDSAEMVLACKYAEAGALYDSADYEEAYAIYEQLSDYKDSAERVFACQYAQAGELYDEGDYEGALAIYELILDYKNSANWAAAANHEILYSVYGDVIDLLMSETYYYNGGADTLLNGISFTKTAATIQQVIFDGNGSHSNGISQCEYTLNDDMITITMSSGQQLDILYHSEGNELVLGDGDYFTIDDVVDGLQGYWTYATTSFGCKEETNMLIDGDSYIVEQANEGFNLPTGRYYYYGPYIGFYSVGFGELDFNSRLGTLLGWGFNIIDGEVVAIHYGYVCSRGDGLPGQNGYTF